MLYAHLFLILSSLLFFPFCASKSSRSKQDRSSKEVEVLLLKSANSEGLSLDSSILLTDKAYQFALKLKNDSLLCKCYLLKGINFRKQGKSEQALVFFQQSLDLSQKINHQSSYCQALIEMGSVFYIHGDYEKAKMRFQLALEYAKKNNLQDHEAVSLSNIGKCCHTMGNFNESVKYYMLAIQGYEKQGNALQSANVLLSLGKTYYNAGSLYQALKYYLEAYKISERTKDYSNLADVCNYLGSIYLALHHPDRAMEYHRKALTYRIRLQTKEGMASSFNNIGKVFLSINQADSARVYFLKSLKICEQITYAKGQVKALCNLGKTYNSLSKPSQALSYLRQSLQLAEKTGYDAGIAEASLAIGNALLDLKQNDSAQSAFKTCLEKAASAHLTELNHDGYWGLHRYYKATKNYEKSLEYYIQYAEAEKKLLQSENDHQLAELRITFESEKKEKDNEVLRKENELKEMTILRKSTLVWMIFSALGFAIVLVVLLYFRFNNKRKANRRLEQLNNRITKQNLELEKLNKELENANREKDKIFSIISHELRNPLYWFQNLTEMLSLRYQSMSKDKVQKSLQSLDESAKNAFHLMDNLLHWSRSRLNRITPRISEQLLNEMIHEASRMYESILQHKNIQLLIHVPENASVLADPDLFTCVVRNLVSNAIKFTPENGRVQISANKKGANFIISISDTGVGISPKNRINIFESDQYLSTQGLMNEKGTGFGLKLCKEFVEINKGKIWIDTETNEGTCFHFSVPAGRG